MSDNICYLNGQYQPISEAKISVLDRGFIFGDGIYEVVPVYEQKLFRFDQHIERLSVSLSKIFMKNPLPRDEWLQICRTLVSKLGIPNQVVYIQVTRGVAKRDHVLPKDIPATVFAMTNQMAQPTDEQRKNGVECITTDDFRWQKGDIKSTSLLGACLARQMSAEVGAIETIMFRNGMLTEASAANIWIVKNGELLAPIKDHLKLEGIRYGLLEELCTKHGQKLSLKDISEAEVRNADEIVITSATKEVLPCTKLDGQVVGTGLPGPVYRKLYEWYQQEKLNQSI
jgi:D-alanine transaminase